MPGGQAGNDRPPLALLTARSRKIFKCRRPVSASLEVAHGYTHDGVPQKLWDAASNLQEVKALDFGYGDPVPRGTGRMKG